MIKLSGVIEELVEERSLDRATLSGIVCEALLAAYNKKYPEVEVVVRHDRKSDAIEILAVKKVVSQVGDEDKEISLRKARALDPDVVEGAAIEIPFVAPIGRIEILKARQVISQRIRGIEAAALYQEFKPKEGAIVYGTVYKLEHNGAVIKLGEATAFLPRSLTIPGETLSTGYTVRALLREVLQEPRQEYQLILDRTSPEFLERLFELEVPEVFEKIVEIKRVARIAGYKSKVVVVSTDPNIDPVGTCVGMGGARIKPILRELGSEKIDIIEHADHIEEFVRNALKPAVVNRVAMDDARNARVWVDEDQRSLAIGRSGQNIALASQLTGVQIHLAKPTAITTPFVEENTSSDEGAE